MKFYFSLFTLFLLTPLVAKELFGVQNISEYLNPSNPFFYSAIGKESIYKERDRYYLGELDSKLFLKYDKKEYPLSSGEFLDTGVHKTLENGVEVTLAYRKAEGTQEYNNIKTGDEGEVRAGVTLPVLAVLNGMNSRKLNIDAARLDKIKFKHTSNDNLRILYSVIVEEYYKVLYYKAVVEAQEKLFHKVQRRKQLIDKRVKSGTLAEVARLEAQQQSINTEQNLLLAQNDFFSALERFVKYLNISRDVFETKYSLGVLEETAHSKISLDNYVELAIENRPDLKAYELEIKKIHLQQKQTQLLGYPKMDLSFYGVHDFKYDDGFKVALDMEFPIERRKYEGKNIENKNSIKNLQMNKSKEILSIRTKLVTIVNSLDMFEKNLESSKVELQLLEKLEEAENKKYLLGMSNLYMVNQRERATLNVEQKVLKYHFECLLLEQEAKREAGVSFFE